MQLPTVEEADQILTKYLDVTKHPKTELYNMQSWQLMIEKKYPYIPSWMERFEVIIFHFRVKGVFQHGSRRGWIKRQLTKWNDLCYLQKELLMAEPGLLTFAMCKGSHTSLIGTKDTRYESWQTQKLQCYIRKWQTMPKIDDPNEAVRALARWVRKTTK
jgi:hypothetical protein